MSLAKLGFFLASSGMYSMKAIKPYLIDALWSLCFAARCALTCALKG